MACGSGEGLRFLSSRVKSGTVIAATDISTGMLERLHKGFESSDFCSNPLNKVVVLEDKHDIDVSDEAAKVGEFNKLVLAKEANNEALPFKSEQFEAYIAALSLMLVNNHKLQLKEAYRVLQPNGKAGFTVWGRVENATCFTFLESVANEFGIEFTMLSKDPYFHLNDKDKLV